MNLQENGFGVFWVMKSETILVFGVFAVLLVAGSAMAAPGQAAGFGHYNQYTDYNQYTVSSRAAYASCIVGFNIGALNLELAAAPAVSSTVTPSVTALTADNTTLAGFTDADALATLQAFTDGQLKTDLVAGRQAFIGALGQIPAGNGTRKDISSGVKALQQARDACQSGSLQQIGGGRVQDFNQTLTQYQNGINQLASAPDSFTGTSLDVAGLDSVVANGYTAIVDPLQAALTAAGSNSTLARQALEQYCLFDGCSAAGAVNYHLEANFLSAYLTARGQQISANASADGVSMTQFNTDLGSATTLLSSIGTNAYQNGQQGQLYGLLAKAGSDLQKVRNQVSQADHAGQLVGRKLQAYTQEIAQVQSQVSARFPANSNASLAGIDSVLAGANTTVIQPLQAALATGTPATLLAAANGYCLTDGCQASGAVNYHLDAQLSIAELALRASILQAANSSIDLSGI